jgi:hypothetical protein
MNAESMRSFDRIAVSSLFAEAVALQCGAAKSCHADVAFSKFHVIWRAPIQRCEDHTETNRRMARRQLTHLTSVIGMY